MQLIMLMSFSSFTRHFIFENSAFEQLLVSDERSVKQHSVKANFLNIRSFIRITFRYDSKGPAIRKMQSCARAKRRAEDLLSVRREYRVES